MGLQTLQSIERELYLFRMEVQEAIKKLSPQEEQEKKARKCKGWMSLLAIFIISLACVSIASTYFLFNFLKEATTPKAIPAFSINSAAIPIEKHSNWRFLRGLF